MIAPCDLMYNGKVYMAGETIPASEKKLIKTLLDQAEESAILEAEVNADPPTAKTGKGK